jgi:hypothetical protein
MPSRLHTPAIRRPVSSPAPPPTCAQQWLADALSDRPRSFFRLLIENLIAALLVLSVAILSDQVPEPWHDLANIAAAVSLVAYSLRLTFSQHRQQKGTSRPRESREQPARSARPAHAFPAGCRVRATELNPAHRTRSAAAVRHHGVGMVPALARLLLDAPGLPTRVDDHSPRRAD